MPGRTMRLMSLSTQDCRAENATGSFRCAFYCFDLFPVVYRDHNGV